MSLGLCLITSDAEIEASLRASCPPPARWDVYARENLVNESHTISEHGLRVVDAAASSDLVLIDWSIEEAPAINTLCFRIRRDLVAPIVAVSRGGPEAMITHLATGADFSVTLPVYQPYLEALNLSYRRIVEAVRAKSPGPTESESGSGSAPAGADEYELTLGKLKLNHLTHRFFIDDREVELTPREFSLLAYLISRADQLCSRDDILSAVWGLDFDTGTNMVDVYMHYLRRKLEAHGLDDMVQTVRGLGYRLVPLE